MWKRNLTYVVIAALATQVAAVSAGPLSFYAVDDRSARNSQLVHIDYNGSTSSIATLGGTYNGLDIEGIDFHPATNVLYAIGGENGQSGKQHLYTWSTIDGSLTDLGAIGGDTNPFDGHDMIASAFRSDASYWICIEDAGLYTLDLTTRAATLQSADAAFATGDGTEGLAWSPSGTTLYAARGKTLYAWDPLSDTKWEVTPAGAAIGFDVEALEFDLDGNLIAAGSDHVAQLALVGGQYTVADAFSVTGRDIESLAFAVPEPSALGLMALVVAFAARRR